MIDVTQQLRDVERRVGSRSLEAGPARTVTISQTYGTDINDLWDACTSAERILRWFLPITGELRVGGRYQLEGNAGGTIEECEPPHRFFATWEFGGKVTWIEVRLVPESSDRTRLEIEHIADVDDDTLGAVRARRRRDRMGHGADRARAAPRLSGARRPSGGHCLDDFGGGALVRGAEQRAMARGKRRRRHLGGRGGRRRGACQRRVWRGPGRLISAALVAGMVTV